MGQYLSHDFFTDIQIPSVNPLNPARPPISGKEALSALRMAEHIDNYRKKIDESSVNLSARRNQEYMPVVYSVPRPIESNTTWPNGQVLWMDASADGGLPHTRPPHYICLPINIPDSVLSKTLLHERIHLSQRKYPEKWQALFKIAWNMTPWYGTIPGRLRHLQRINPDLINIPLYAWKNEWVVFSVFTSSTPKTLSEVKRVWWHIPSSTIHNDPPPGWVTFFGDNPHGEHPYEIAAYLLAESTAPDTPALPALSAINVNISRVQE